MARRDESTARPDGAAVGEPIPERPESLPSEPLRYELQPTLVRYLTWAHRNAGKVGGMRFSHYGRKRLEVEAHRKRITYMVMRAGHESVTLDEVTYKNGERRP